MYGWLHDTKFAERPLYHAATFILNLADFTDEHKPKYNWDLVKSLDSYYSGDVQSRTNSTGDNTNPATGSEAVSGIVLLGLAAGVIVVSKKKR